MDESPVLAQFRTKFRVEELLVAKNTAWSWSLRPAQATLGAGVLSLNRYAASFSDVSGAEMAEMAVLVGQLEKALKCVFGYDVILGFSTWQRIDRVTPLLEAQPKGLDLIRLRGCDN